MLECVKDPSTGSPTGEHGVKRDAAGMVPTRAQVHPYPISGLRKQNWFILTLSAG